MSDRLLPSRWPYSFQYTSDILGCNVVGLQRAEFWESIIQPGCWLYNAGGINPGNTSQQIFRVMFSANNPAQHDTRARLKQALSPPGTLKLVMLQVNLARILFIQLILFDCLFQKPWLLRSAEVVHHFNPLLERVLERSTLKWHTMT